MSRIERITRARGGADAVRRAQGLLAVPRVGPRPDRAPEELAEEERERAAERRDPAPRDAPGHLDIRA